MTRGRLLLTTVAVSAAVCGLAAAPARADRIVLPALWSETLGVSHCEHEAAGEPRTVFDFDEQGRLVRERRWRQPPDRADDDWEWGVMRWTYETNGGYTRESIERPSSGPWARGMWEELDTLRVEARVEGQWIHHLWTYPGGSEERRFRIERHHLAQSEGTSWAGSCTFDDAGRPLAFASDFGDRIEWHYTDGVLSAIDRTQFGYSHTTLVERGPDHELVLGTDHYRGDCAEVVFLECSAVMMNLADPLPAGLLPD